MPASECCGDPFALDPTSSDLFSSILAHPGPLRFAHMPSNNGKMPKSYTFSFEPDMTFASASSSSSSSAGLGASCTAGANARPGFSFSFSKSREKSTTSLNVGDSVPRHRVEHSTRSESGSVAYRADSDAGGSNGDRSTATATGSFGSSSSTRSISSSQRMENGKATRGGSKRARKKRELKASHAARG